MLALVSYPYSSFLFQKFLLFIRQFLLIIKLIIALNLGSTIHIVCNYKCHSIEEIYQPEDHVDTMTAICHRILSRLRRSFEANFAERSRFEVCNWCANVPPSYFNLRSLGFSLKIFAE